VDVARGVALYVALAETHFSMRLRLPSFDMTLRGLAAGRADLTRWHLRFNATLLRENREHFLKHTVGHEVAHLVTFALWGRRAKPHGHEWRAVMAVYGLPAHATHRYDVSNIPRRRSPYVYRCRCENDVFFGSLRHKRTRRGVRYFCRRCGAPLEFVRVAKRQRAM
jgi:SprT protein